MTSAAVQSQTKGRDSRIKRIDQAASYVGLSRATIYRLIKTGDFPSPLRLGERSVGFDSEDLDEWLDAKKRQRDTTLTEAE